MYDERIEGLIKAALVDGMLTEKEKQVLFKRAQEQGIDLDEFEMILDARLVELQKEEKEKAAKSAPKSDKYGDVRKCPVCGALVPALAVSCSECGYEFTGIEASSSAQKLARLISDIRAGANKRNSNGLKEQLKLDNEIESVVNTFPVPNTKNDLFDLMMFLKNRGYYAKFEECLDRAKYLYPNDTLFVKIEDEHKTEEKKKNMFGLWCLIAFLLICIVMGLLSHFGIIQMPNM